MSDVAEQVTASLLLCDFANNDAAGKLNVVGGGLRIIGFDPSTEMSNPFTLVLTMEAPLSGDSPALEILLTTSTGQVYKVPGPNGMQAVRISQNIDFSPPSVPGLTIPKGAIPSTGQVVINFANGLPLKQGYSYQFRAQIDHETVATYSFYIPIPPTGPVLG